MNKTKFFRKIEDINCDKYSGNLITTSYSFTNCAKYKGYAMEWNDNNKSKKVYVDVLEDVLLLFVPKCVVTCMCLSKNTE